MSVVQELQPVEWISKMFIALLASAINIIILVKERKKRNYEDIKFTTKWLRLFSLSSIICGTLYSIIHIIGYFPIFCTFDAALLYSLMASQAVCIGLYQLSRIYYCFSQTQVHSTNGYPNWLFVIMYTFGILIAVNVCVCSFIVTSWNANCSINNKWQYIYRYNQTFLGENEIFALMININTFSYIIWDIITLLLYVLKIYSFRKYKTEQPEVYNRIMSILKRVVILTILYQVVAILCLIIAIFLYLITDNIIMRILYTFSFLSYSVISNYSMYLMQQHNDHQYNEFLKVLHKLKVHYLCCCCKSEIDNAFKLDPIEMNCKDNNNNDDGAISTIWETRDMSLPKQMHFNLSDTNK